MKIRSLLFFLFVASFFLSCTKDPEIANKVPVADAGPVKNVTLPATVTLTGTGTDADGTIKAFLWSQVSGPAASTISNPGNATTAIKFTIDGAYLFQLMVTDDMGATGVDTVTVIVNAPPQQTLSLQPFNNPFDFRPILWGADGTSTISLQDIPLVAWTLGGTPLTVRSLLKFDLSTIPQTSTIVSANLYLYSYPSPVPNGNFVNANFGANNAIIVQRITNDWTPSFTNWYNQPSTGSRNQIIVPHTTSSNLDLNLDVTAMVSPMIANDANYGFGMRLQSESIFTSRIFVSSYNTTYPDKRPKLIIVYK